MDYMDFILYLTIVLFWFSFGWYCCYKYHFKYSENETGVSDSPTTHGDLPLVRTTECEAIESDKLTSEAEHGTLENRIDSESCFTNGNYRCKCGLIKPDCDNWKDCEFKTTKES